MSPLPPSQGAFKIFENGNVPSLFWENAKDKQDVAFRVLRWDGGMRKEKEQLSLRNAFDRNQDISEMNMFSKVI